MDNSNYLDIPQVVLLACGSFNPPTCMHLRMFELARDFLYRKGQVVIGGIISPVHDAYGKKELEHSSHRIAMIKEALKDSDWIKLSQWETQQENWSKTRTVLQYHQNQLNAFINDTNNMDISNNIPSWIPDVLKNRNKRGTVAVKLLCGGDLLESFAVPGLWNNDDIEYIIGEHGLVVITRIGSQPDKFIYESDLLYRYTNKIDIVTEWITNEVSSTKIRRALRRAESVKYLLANGVIDYILKNKLYGTDQNTNKYLIPTNINQTNFLLTPSPSDISKTPSPLDNTTYNNIIDNKNDYNKMSIDTVDSINKLNVIKTGVTHPGQAVKIITDLTGEHKVINASEVCNSNIIADSSSIIPPDNNKTDDFKKRINDSLDSKIKGAKSCQNFNKTNLKHVKIKSSKSNTQISDYHNGDQNLIKFVFTKDGTIQVISDVETIV